MAALARAASCQAEVTQWVAACSGLLQTATVQGQCRRMLHGIFQRCKTGQFQLPKACGGLIEANGAKTHQNRLIYSTSKQLSAKDSVQTSEEKVGPFTRIIEAMGFTGPLKYSRWKIKVAALRMYTCCVEKTDYEEFFNRCQMPDTLNSWFLVAQLHVWMCLVRMKQEGRAGKYMCRYIVHCMWEDVEQRGKVMGFPGCVGCYCCTAICPWSVLCLPLTPARTTLEAALCLSKECFCHYSPRSTPVRLMCQN
eukprot:XP_024997957.1 ubiquinol-cytochrome c reductase complex assembly factor 1 isoform X2 [Gallus gallus]